MTNSNLNPESKKTTPLVIGIIIIALLAIAVIWFVGNSANLKNGGQPDPDNNELSDAEIQSILNNLETNENEASLSDEEIQSILNNLETEGNAEAELSDAEIQAILNNLSTGN